jgi:hypothetical protein
VFKQAVDKIGKGNISPNTIHEAVKGVELIALRGKLRLDGENLHTCLWPKIAQAKSTHLIAVARTITRRTAFRIDPASPYKPPLNGGCANGALMLK